MMGAARQRSTVCRGRVVPGVHQRLARRQPRLSRSPVARFSVSRARPPRQECVSHPRDTRRDRASRRPRAAARMRRRATVQGIGVTSPASTSARRRWISSAQAASMSSPACSGSSRLSISSATTAARPVAGRRNAATSTFSTSLVILEAYLKSRRWTSPLRPPGGRCRRSPSHASATPALLSILEKRCNEPVLGSVSDESARV